MKNKVGIITHYYNSLNYGGNLQAYALCRYFNKQGIDAEQICYVLPGKVKERNINIKLYLKKHIKEFIYKRQIDSLRRTRGEAFHNFNKVMIPHSVNQYTEENIQECVKEYDLFVTGSDQVWNLLWYRRAFFLDFVPHAKHKVSYAASIGMNRLDDEQKNIFKNSLQSFDSISVRENDAVELLSSVIDKEISYVVDPTFLLNTEDWDEVCEKRIYQEKYIFAYFLGSNNNAKMLAQEFARTHNIQLIYIPYASGQWNRREFIIGDVKMMDASPEKFLSLIKYAEYVFTDSFHAVVFSVIFRTQFFVFNRDEKGSMSSRITSLTDMFDMKNRFCATKECETMEYIECLEEIDYIEEFPKFKSCLENSYEFIRKNIIEVVNGNGE